jgi:hypothetical protein
MNAFSAKVTERCNLAEHLDMRADQIYVSRNSHEAFWRATWITR